MEWYFVIIISLIAALLFGFATKDKMEKEKINLRWFFLVMALSLLLAFILPFLIAIWCALACYIYKITHADEPEFYTFMVFILVSVFFIGLYMIYPATTQTEEVGNISLVALRSAIGTDGSFLLGTGSIDTEFYYTYGHMKDQEYIQDLIKKTNKVHVYPGRTDKQGFIIFYKSYDVRNLSTPLKILFDGISEKLEKDSWTEIHIPPESIMQGMKI